MEKEVKAKWNTDGDLAVIYLVQNILLFYTKERDPEFKKGEKVTFGRVEQSKPYKAIPFSWDNVPNDASISLEFALAK